MMKLVLCGPPHSGKSCLRYGLRGAIMSIAQAPYPYVITANPDGEGCWFHEAAGADAELARKLKEAYKAEYSDERVSMFSTWVENCAEPLVMVDIGGIPDAYKEQICRTATHALLLSPHQRGFAEWRAFCRKVGLTIIAEIVSDFHGTSDVVPTCDSDGVYRGSVHYLQRGDLSIKDRPTIRALAEVIVTMTSTPQEQT